MNTIKSMQLTKLFFVLISGVVLASCGGGNSSSQTITDVTPDAGETPASRIVFDAGAGALPLPSDLLFSGTADGTIEPPDETAGRDAGSIDYGNPGAALGVADGWSTMLPMQVSLDMAESATVDAATVGAATVVMIETVTPPTDGSGAGCIPVEPFVSLSPGLPCGVVAPLTYGVDFVAVAGTDSITIAPLSPLDAKTTYVVGILDGVLDSRGEAILASTQYEQVTRSDIDIDFPSLDSLQDAVNLYEAIIDLGTGGDGSAPADALFSAAWTTGSVGDALGTATSLLAAAPPSITAVTDLGVTVEDALIGSGSLPPEADGTTGLDAAMLASGSVSLPYYSGTPLDGSDPLTDGWKALCDSPLAVLAAVGAGVSLTAGPNHATCVAASGGSLADYGLDSERHLTKYNPIPAARGNAVIDVQITYPAAAPAPWPIVILQHGITTNKETFLGITGSLAAAGFATFAIDHPLHGSRTLASSSALDGIADADTISGDGDATDYMNLANLPAARDNLRQSAADLLGLRMAINNSVSDAGAGALVAGNFDTANVHMVGWSLGAMSGTPMVTLANSLGLGLDIQSAAFFAPGGGIVPFLSESPGFGPLVQGSVLAGSGTDLGDTFVGFIGTNAPCAGDIGCNFTDFTATLDATSLAEISGLISQFIFAAQTILEPMDPNNYAASLAALATPIHMSEVVGDGVNNLPDQTIPNVTVTPGLTFGGTEPLAAFLGLEGVDADNDPQSSGIVRFTAGSHGSIVDPGESADSAAVTTELQTQIATFLATGSIVISNATVVVDLP